MRWDTYFMGIAKLVATRSKDQSTKVGAVLVQGRRIIATGYNGFPKGVEDDIQSRHERPDKYLWTSHAEENTIVSCASFGISTEGSILFVTPMQPCATCARLIIAAGISKVIYEESFLNPRFKEQFEIASTMLQEAGVEVIKLNA